MASENLQLQLLGAAQDVFGSLIHIGAVRQDVQHPRRLVGDADAVPVIGGTARMGIEVEGREQSEREDNGQHLHKTLSARLTGRHFFGEGTHIGHSPSFVGIHKKIKNLLPDCAKNDKIINTTFFAKQNLPFPS